MDIKPKKPGVTYCIITSLSERGFVMTKHAMPRKQYKAIRRQEAVVIRNIGRANFLLLQ